MYCSEFEHMCIIVFCGKRVKFINKKEDIYDGSYYVGRNLFGRGFIRFPVKTYIFLRIKINITELRIT